MSKSEMADFRQQQALSEQAAQQGLNGFAEVGPHARRTAHTVDCSQQVLDLLAAGDTAGAAALVLNDNFWIIEDK